MDEGDAERGLSDDIGSPADPLMTRDAGTPLTIARFGIPLYPYHAVPSFLKGNSYITEGYRAFLSDEMCIKSIVICSNETVNIWSHLIGLFSFTVLLFLDNLSFLPATAASWGDHLTFTVMCCCFQVCMFCSASYHTFYCKSEAASRRWLQLDLVGVSIGLCGCYYAGSYYGFYCSRFWKVTYSCVMISLALASIFAQVHPHFLSNHWHLRRVVLYAALMFAGVIPVMHWMVASGGPSQPIVQTFMPKILIMYALAIIGGAFFVTKFPESYFPGHVNYIASSHQWWHVMVLLTFAWTHHMTTQVHLYWKMNECPHSTTLSTIENR